MEDIKGEDFAEMLNNIPENMLFIDVREELEFHTYNIGGQNIPLGKLLLALENQDLEIPENTEIIVICQRGIRSHTAKIALEQNGYKNVRNLLGGLLKLQRIKLS